eukprot:1884911-Rhodomonas_salina.1
MVSFVEVPRTTDVYLGIPTRVASLVLRSRIDGNSLQLCTACTRALPENSSYTQRTVELLSCAAAYQYPVSTVTQAVHTQTWFIQSKPSSSYKFQ